MAKTQPRMTLNLDWRVASRYARFLPSCNVGAFKECPMSKAPLDAIEIEDIRLGWEEVAEIAGALFIDECE